MRFDKWDEDMMSLALEQASIGATAGEVPVGSVVTMRDFENGEEFVLSKSYNQCIGLCDPSAHAEIQSLKIAGESKKNYRLPATVLYVTLEPCIMCLGAILHARVARIVIGALEPKTGAIFSNPINISSFPYADPKWEYGLMSDESAQILQDFFKDRR